MKQKTYSNARYVKTAVFLKDYPVLRDIAGRLLPEVAVVGRSNVGKSSLLNDIFQTKHLVKTSSTPGKTQTLNFFTVNNEIAFVDLPGYGYANVPISIRKQWGPMIQNYLETRETLKLILFLFDIRRIPTEEDREFIEWVVYHEKAMILVLTKVDKVNQSEKQLNTRRILKDLNAENIHYLYYSVLKKLGRKNLLAMINEALSDEFKSAGG